MAINGLDSRIKIGANIVLDLNNVTFTLNGETYDKTTFDSGKFKEKVAGMVDATGSISGFYNPNDTNGQVALRNALLNGTPVADFTYLPDKNDATSGFVADMIITSFEVSSQVGGLVAVSIGFESTGTISASS
jgi:predicted secreted protein